MSNAANKYKIRSKKNFDKKAANYFDTWDGKYSLLMYGEVINRINRYSFRSILDVGCGPGVMLSRVINHHGNAQAFGIDLSENMIKKASELLTGKAELVVGDSEDLPWEENTFDIVVCNSSFHHYPEPVKVLSEMRRVLKPKGGLIMADPWWTGILRYFINIYCKSPFNLEGDFHIYSEKEIVQMLRECGFMSMECENPIGKYYVVSAMVDK